MDVGSLVRGLQELVVKLLVLVWVSVISLLPAVSSQQKQYFRHFSYRTPKSEPSQ